MVQYKEYKISVYEKILTKILNLISYKLRSEKEITSRLDYYLRKEEKSSEEKNIIREKILRSLKEEIPHGTAVEVMQMKKRDDKEIYDICIERKVFPNIFAFEDIILEGELSCYKNKKEFFSFLLLNLKTIPVTFRPVFK